MASLQTLNIPLETRSHKPHLRVSPLSPHAALHLDICCHHTTDEAPNMCVRTNNNYANASRFTLCSGRDSQQLASNTPQSCLPNNSNGCGRVPWMACTSTTTFTSLQSGGAKRPLAPRSHGQTYCLDSVNIMHTHMYNHICWVNVWYIVHVQRGYHNKNRFVWAISSTIKRVQTEISPSVPKPVAFGFFVVRLV